MKARSLPLPGGCWKLQSIRLHQAREAPMEDYDGRQVVGMDLHRHRSVLVRMTEDGRRLGTARITNSAAELRREIARAGRPAREVGQVRHVVQGVHAQDEVVSAMLTS